MTETVRLNLTVDDDIPDKLSDLAGGTRKMGTYLTDLVRAIHDQQVQVDMGSDVEALRLQLLGLSGTVKQQDGRLVRLEQTVAAMVARGAGS